MFCVLFYVLLDNTQIVFDHGESWDYISHSHILCIGLPMNCISDCFEGYA